MPNSEYEIRDFEWRDIGAIAARMRPQDVEEVWAAFHHTPESALRYSAEVSRDAIFTGVANGAPVCAFGVTPPSLLGDVAVPWMLGTIDLNFHSRKFLRESRRVVSLLAEEFPVMENYVDARNTASIRWLQWVGFSVYYPKPYGRDNLPFHRFDMRA